MPGRYKNVRGKSDAGLHGIQYIAEKYALDKPISVTTELVYDTGHLQAAEKDRENRVESYEFEINNAFDRGSIVGGFGYIEYQDPTKNKLVIMTLKDILKRKPKNASESFGAARKRNGAAENGQRWKQKDGLKKCALKP